LGKILKTLKESSQSPSTRGIERFSAKEIFEKILKVSHFHLGFSPAQINNQIKHSQRVSLEFSESGLGKFDETFIKCYENIQFDHGFCPVKILNQSS